MRYLILLAVCAFLPSCGLYKSLSENSEKVREGIGIVTDTVADVKVKYDEVSKTIDGVVATVGSISAAVDGLAKDQDGDGDVDFNDLLLGLGGLGVAGGGAVAARNRASAKSKEAERERAKGVEAQHAQRLALIEQRESDRIAANSVT